MFNLEQAIAEWRRQMLAAGIKAPVPLEELESHLREDFDAQIRAGAAPERAFEIAAGRLGLPAALRQEFRKVGKVMLAWARKMNYTVSAVVAVLFCAVGLMLLFNIPHSHVAPGAQDLLASWRFSYRFLPVIHNRKTRLAATIACGLAGLAWLYVFAVLLFTVIVPHIFSESSAAQRVEFRPVFAMGVATLWAIALTAVLGGFAYGLEEAAQVHRANCRVTN
jgi:hypothetical protein